MAQELSHGVSSDDEVADWGTARLSSTNRASGVSTGELMSPRSPFSRTTTPTGTIFATLSLRHKTPYPPLPPKSYIAELVALFVVPRTYKKHGKGSEEELAR